MTLLTPGGLWLLTLLPVVVALHYLRVRRERREVSALFLWRRAHAALAKRRRFSPTWLLVAQLLFVTLAALALARPELTAGSQREVVVIIDASASMAAVTEGRSRLEEAAQQAEEVASGATSVLVIRAGVSAHLVGPAVGPGQLRRELNQLRAGDHKADLLGATRLATSLAPEAEVHVFTDHDAQLGSVEVHRVGEPVENVGISGFDVGLGQAFLAVVASGGRPAEVPVELWQGERLLAAGTVLVPVGGVGTITFPLQDVTGVIEARLLPPPGDALALDDVAYAGSPPLTVVSADDDRALIRVLTAVPHTEVRYTRGAVAARADLKVLTGADPDALPAGNYLIFAPPANEPQFRVISDYDRASRLTRFVDLRNVVVGLEPTRTLWQMDGWQALARTRDLTPVVRVRKGQGGTVVQFAFHPSQSDLALRPAFPALIANVLGQLQTAAGVRLGEPLIGEAEGILEPGVYVTNGGFGAGEVHASLLAADESRLPETLAGEGPITAPSAVEGQPARRVEGSKANTGVTPVAYALLLLAGLALVAEWFIFRGRFRTRAAW